MSAMNDHGLERLQFFFFPVEDVFRTTGKM